jgi:putative ABC transport system permease protein
MRPLTILRLRLRTLFRSRQLDRELDEELRYHLDRETQRNVNLGCPPTRHRQRPYAYWAAL